MGTNDPLYSHIDALVHRILDGFTDDLTIFDEAREKLERFLADEEQAAEANIQSTAEEIDQTDRKEMAEIVAKSEIERRIEMYPVPNFLAWFLRQQWVHTLQDLYLAQGEESEPWEQSIAMLEDLVWSVQPKRTKDDRKHLVALLPALLKRLSAALERIEWPPEGREKFMANLVEAHAASVKPTVATAALGTASVAEQALAEAEQAKADGDEEKAAKAEALAEAMTQAAPEPVKEPEVIEDQFLEIAQDLERGTWIEFEADDGQLQFAKLAWISPLRGTYLFTNRQGLKALSMNAEELAERFRTDRARLVEAAPLIDRAFGSVMASFAEGHAGAGGVRTRRRRTPRRAFVADFDRRVTSPHRRAHHRRRDPLGQARRSSPRARHRDARGSRPRARVGALRRRRPRCARRFPPRVVRARRRRVLVRRRGRHAGRSHATGGRHGALRSARTASGGRRRARSAVRRHRLSAPRADGRISRRRDDHPESGQSRRLVRDSRSFLLPRISADGVADARLGAGHAPAAARGHAVGERAIVVYGAGESQLLPLMEACVARYPQLKLFSLPSFLQDGGRRLELGVRGELASLDAALRDLVAGVEALGFRWEPFVPSARADRPGTAS
jgi:hypothetical protein